MSEGNIRIAVAVGESGAVRTCGPDDYEKTDHNDAMSAAITWLLEAGEITQATYWIDAQLPDPVKVVEGIVSPVSPCTTGG